MSESRIQGHQEFAESSQKRKVLKDLKTSRSKITATLVRMVHKEAASLYLRAESNLIVKVPDLYFF